jgi:hypothetical protein
MQVFFIEQNDKRRFIDLFRKMYISENSVKLNVKWNKLKIKQKIKLVNKISGYLKFKSINKIIIEKNLKQKDMMDLFYSNQIDIIQGKQLFKILVDEFIEKVIIKNNLKTDELRISVLMNDKTKWGLNLIRVLIKKYKYVNVVTNNINGFKNIEDKLFEDEGIILNFTNNKKKALSKTNIIINVDFPEEIINKYAIYDNGIIINLEEPVKIYKKRFNGKIINDYEINLKEDSKIYEALSKEEYKKFELKDLAEYYIENSPEELKNIIIDSKK